VAGVRLDDVRDQVSFLLELGRAGPEVVAYPARGSTAFLVTDPRCAARVLGGGEPAYEADRHPYGDLTGSYTHHGMTVLGLSRRDSTAAVREDLAGDLSAAATATAERLVDRSGGRPVPVLDALHELLLCFTARLLFDVDVAGFAAPFVRAVRLLEECWANNVVPDPSMRPLHQDYVDALRAENETLDGIARSAGISAPRAVILRTLLNAYHGTATAMAWALWELARNPDVQEKVRREVGNVCPGRAPTAADTPSLQVTRLVVLESLRLHPPAWNIGRTAAQEHELGGTRIPAGSHLSVSPYVMHRSHGFWPAPDEFVPERFVAGAATRRPRCTYLPFGAGLRRCPAARHAIEQLQILLAEFVRHARFQDAGMAVRPRGLIGLRPEPDVYLRIVGTGWGLHRAL
jgi:cytochrome P450